MRTAVVILKKVFGPDGATAATFLSPVLVMPVVGGAPGPAGGVTVAWPGLAAPPITASDWSSTIPTAVATQHPTKSSRPYAVEVSGCRSGAKIGMSNA